MRVRFLMDFGELVGKVIHLIRHPVGFVSSDVKHGAATVSSSVRGWNRRHGQILRLRHAFPSDRWSTMRYEDLCARPEEEVPRVLEYLGIESANRWIGPGACGEHHVLGNEMRLGWPVRIQMDRSWTSRLGAADVRLILRKTARLREAFGYADWDPLFISEVRGVAGLS